MKKPTIDVNGTEVFTMEWTMEQMQSLINLHHYNRQYIVICAVFTAISLLLSLAAVVIAIVR